MSSLGIALLILVFVGIGAVIAYNAWIVRREGRSVGSLLQEAPPPVDANRTEPSLDAPPEPAAFNPSPAQSYFDVSPRDSDTRVDGLTPGDPVTHEVVPSDLPGAVNLPPGLGAPGNQDITDHVAPGEITAPGARDETADAPRAFIAPNTTVDSDIQKESAPAPDPGAEIVSAGIDPAPVDPMPVESDANKPATGRPDRDPDNVPVDDADDPGGAGASKVPAGVTATDDGVPGDGPGAGAGTMMVQSSSSPNGNQAGGEGRDGNDVNGSDPPGDQAADVAADAPATGEHASGEHEASTAPAADRQAEQPVSRLPHDPFSCTVTLTPDNPVTGGRLAELIGPFSRVGAKPVTVLGDPADGSRAGALQASQRYRSVQFSLLLVNRHGPLNAMEYSEFVNRVQQVAEELDVLPDIPDMGGVLEQSRALDNEVGALDAQVAVNVVTEQAMNPGDLQLISQRLALTEQGNNRYVRMNKQRKPVFSVSLGDRPNQVVLLLDVPRIPRDGQPLREMVECAWKCAQAFEGRMVDDAGQPIDNALFERIERQLDTHYQALAAAGVPAGSPAALRVFQ